VATITHTDTALFGEFPGNPVGHEALHAKDDDTAFMREPGRFGVLYPVHFEARYLRQAAQCTPGQTPVPSSLIKSRPIRVIAQAPCPARRCQPAFSSPDDRIRSISAGLKLSKPFSDQQHSGAERREAFVGGESEIVDPASFYSTCGGQPFVPQSTSKRAP